MSAARGNQIPNSSKSQNANFVSTFTTRTIRAFLSIFGFSGAAFGEYAITIRETDHLHDQPTQVHCGVFLWFAANWALFQNSVPPGKPDTKTTETFDHDPTPDPTRTGKNTPFGHTLTPTIHIVLIVSTSE